MGETHVDVQRTASSNDQTDSACIKSMPNRKCIGLCILLIVLTTYTLQLASSNSIVSLVNIATTRNNKNHTMNNNDNEISKTNANAKHIHVVDANDDEHEHLDETNVTRFGTNQMENCIIF